MGWCGRPDLNRSFCVCAHHETCARGRTSACKFPLVWFVCVHLWRTAALSRNQSTPLRLDGEAWCHVNVAAQHSGALVSYPQIPIAGKDFAIDVEIDQPILSLRR